jgi:hypothetical protein
MRHVTLAERQQEDRPRGDGTLPFLNGTEIEASVDEQEQTMLARASAR